MGLFLGDSEPSKIFVGDTPISKCFLGDTQIRPSGGGAGWDNLDISTAVLSKQYPVGYGYQGLYINPDENVALTSSYNGGSASPVRGYTYSNKDISTAVYQGMLNTVSRIHCIRANNTGTHIYIGDHNGGKIYEYSTTNWDVSTMTLYKTYSVGQIVQAMYISEDERYVIICNPMSIDPSGNSTLMVLEMATPGDISTASVIRTENNVLPYNCHGLTFNRGLTKCVASKYNASSGTLYQYDWDVLNGLPTQVKQFGPVGFTIGYPNVNFDGTTMYAAKESGAIYEYTLS